MKVIYSVGATLGSGGIGVHAGGAVKQLAKAGVLDKVICAGSTFPVIARSPVGTNEAISR